MTAKIPSELLSLPVYDVAPGIQEICGFADRILEKDEPIIKVYGYYRDDLVNLFFHLLSDKYNIVDKYNVLYFVSRQHYNNYGYLILNDGHFRFRLFHPNRTPSSEIHVSTIKQITPIFLYVYNGSPYNTELNQYCKITELDEIVYVVEEKKEVMVKRATKKEMDK